VTTTTPGLIGIHGQTGEGTSAVNEWYYLNSTPSISSLPATNERSAAGWQNTILNPTSSSPYLWNFE